MVLRDNWLITPALFFDGSSGSLYLLLPVVHGETRRASRIEAITGPVGNPSATGDFGKFEGSLRIVLGTRP